MVRSGDQPPGGGRAAAPSPTAPRAPSLRPASRGQTMPRRPARRSRPRRHPANRGELTSHMSFSPAARLPPGCPGHCGSPGAERPPARGEAELVSGRSREHGARRRGSCSCRGKTVACRRAASYRPARVSAAAARPLPRPPARPLAQPHQEARRGRAGPGTHAARPEGCNFPPPDRPPARLSSPPRPAPPHPPGPSRSGAPQPCKARRGGVVVATGGGGCGGARRAHGNPSRRWRGASPPPPGGIFHLTRRTG